MLAVLYLLERNPNYAVMLAPVAGFWQQLSKDGIKRQKKKSFFLCLLTGYLTAVMRISTESEIQNVLVLFVLKIPFSSP